MRRPRDAQGHGGAARTHVPSSEADQRRAEEGAQRSCSKRRFQGAIPRGQCEDAERASDHPHAASRLARASAEPAPRCTPRSSTTVPRDDPQPSNAQRLQTDAYRRGGRGAGERLGIFSGGRHAPRAVGVEGRWAGASWAEAPGRGLQTSSFQGRAARGEGGGRWVKGVKYVAMESKLTVRGEHTV